MFSDFFFISKWFWTIFGLGIISLPIIILIFHKFWDSGYIFSKIFSLMIITYLSLVLGIFKILPFTYKSISLIVLIFLIIEFFIIWKLKKISFVLSTIKQKYRIFIIQELFFLIILTVWSFIRGFAPNIDGLEKYMDWGFINSSLRSTFFPPQDMWFANSSINYYYFGHLVFALITKISQIPSSITYNLSIATVCGLTFLSSFSLTSNFIASISSKINFKKIILIGILSSLLLTFGGNLHPLYKIIKSNLIQNHHLDLSQKAINQSISSYWYPDATRFIGHDPDTQDKTIHEFPIYSFVVSDLHGHMNDIPFVIFFLSCLLTVFLSKKFRKNYLWTILFGFVLAINYMTNAWDFAIYGLFFAIFLMIKNWHDFGINGLIKTFISGGLVIICWYLFSLPFSLNFTPMMEGIMISDGHSPFYQLFILYGGFWIICFPFLVHFFFIKQKKISDFFVFSLIITATILIIIPELIYIKDIYIYEHRRANTMFKLVYQAFIMYSLSSGFVLYRLSQMVRSKIFTSIYKIFFIIVFTIQIIYPYFAIKSFYGLKNYYGLDGLNYLENIYPDNFAAIKWINQNIKGQPVMLEAVGDSYTTFNHVSIATGLPTVQGWIVHEWLWRGGYDQPAARQQEVSIVYESSNLDEIKQIIKKYNIKYIFIGAKEYEKYPKIDIKKFEKLGGKIVFQSGKTIIFQL